MFSDLEVFLFGVLLPFAELLGIVTAVHAVRTVRSSEASIAWAIALVTFPMVALPLFWIFGRNKFSGYVEALRQGYEQDARELQEWIRRLVEEDRSPEGAVPGDCRVFESMNWGYPFVGENAVELLTTGDATFARMFQDMESAREYVLLQYFIVRDDALGRELKKRMEAKAAAGVRVHLLYDEIGSHALPASYLDGLRAAGVRVRPFGTRQGRGNRFQVNFRNHRKITVVDGRVAYVGGHNVGDEYLGRSRRFGRWRDTHLRIEGPSVRHVQMAFLADWYFAAREILSLDWDAAAAQAGGADLLVLTSGPADPVDTCSLMFVQAIHMARQRLWIASPYFIPNEAVLEALQIAALRGVDVRVMLPLRPDHRIVYMAGFWFMARLRLPSLRFFRYEPGFLHQKVFVVDDELAMVGTANADNRSFRLNFEICVLSTTRDLVMDVARMLDADFALCRQVPADEGFTRGLLFDFGVRLARLFSPVL